jgi:hypothetical protein
VEDMQALQLGATRFKKEKQNKSQHGGNQGVDPVYRIPLTAIIISQIKD